VNLNIKIEKNLKIKYIKVYEKISIKKNEIKYFIDILM